MNIKELRVSRLRQLVSADGGITEFVRKRSQPGADKPIDPTYVSQLLNGHRSFGEKAAETMCRRAGLGDGYFDREAIENSTHVITNLSGESLSVASMFERADEDVRQAVLTFLRLSDQCIDLYQKVENLPVIREKLHGHQDSTETTLAAKRALGIEDALSNGSNGEPT